jgi:hypothetical protein
LRIGPVNAARFGTELTDIEQSFYRTTYLATDLSGDFRQANGLLSSALDTNARRNTSPQYFSNARKDKERL